jgi:hypothetical protein
MTTDQPIPAADSKSEEGATQKGGFICPCCTGAGVRGNNRRVERCEECEGEGYLGDDVGNHKIEINPRNSGNAKLPGQPPRGRNSGPPLRHRSVDAEMELDI